MSISEWSKALQRLFVNSEAPSSSPSGETGFSLHYCFRIFCSNSVVDFISFKSFLKISIRKILINRVIFTFCCFESCSLHAIQGLPRVDCQCARVGIEWRVQDG